MSEQRRELSDLLGSIEDCDKEQIHLSGAVQGRGCLIVFDAIDLRVQNVSENTKSILELDQNPLGARLSQIFEASFVNTIQEVFALIRGLRRGDISSTPVRAQSSKGISLKVTACFA